MQFLNITNTYKHNKKLIYFTLFFIYLGSYFYGRNNACTNIIDYFIPNISPNCYYEPDTFATMPDILHRHVSHFETYDIKTEDGYILKIFRIPQFSPKGTIILHHALSTDAIIWVGQSNESLAFILWNLGYDIWLPCHRGTFYSRKHVNLTTDSKEFWNFGFHEIGVHDYSAIYKFIKKKTGNKDLIVVSHSMATTSSIIYSCTKPEEAKNLVKLFIMVSPVATFRYTTSPASYLAILINKLTKYPLFNKNGYTLGYDGFFHSISKFLVNLPIKHIFQLIINVSCGWTENEFDPKLINLALSLFPRGSSWKNLVHYSQLVATGNKFNRYDYGPDGNVYFYNNRTPPEYPIEDIKNPIYFIYSTDDSIATDRDTENLYYRLNEKVRIGKHKISGINHVDYMFGKSRIKKVFIPLIRLIENWTLNNDSYC